MSSTHSIPDHGPNRREPMHTLAIIILAAAACASAAAQCPSPSWNGYCPETTPRTGEQRVSALQYKASHNSYERSESLDEQIDDYNCWMLELDCWWLDSDIHVRHLCSGTNGPLFTSKLQEIAASGTATQKFTFIYLELKYDCTNDNCECGFGETCHSWPTGYRSTFRTEIESYLDSNRIYTADEWVAIDDYAWPSIQELVRRGKSYAFIIDERCTGDAGNSYFFEVTTGGSGYTTLINRDAGCDGGESPGAVTPTTRFLYRAYPSAGCAGLCSGQNEEYWSDATRLGYSFIATNCVSDEHTFDYSEVHSPMPFYVVYTGSPSHQWGTSAFPKVGAVGLLTATLTASPMVDVVVAPGDYPLSPLAGGTLTINRPMVLHSTNPFGDVVIR